MAKHAPIPLLILLGIVIPLAGSCEVAEGGGGWLQGDGVAGSEEREVASFDRVDIRNAFAADVHVEEGSPGAVTIRADRNLLPHVETYVVGTTLVVDIEGDIQGVLPLEVDVITDDLLGARATNAVALQVTGIDATSFEIEATNSSTTTLRGRADDLQARALNASAITADDLRAESALAEALNASSLSLCVTGDVEGSAVNSSLIAVHCSPTSSDVPTDVGSSLETE